MIGHSAQCTSCVCEGSVSNNSNKESWYIRYDARIQALYGFVHRFSMLCCEIVKEAMFRTYEYNPCTST